MHMGSKFAVVLACVAAAASTSLVGGTAASAARTGHQSHVYPVLYGTGVRTRSGGERIHSKFTGLAVPSATTSTSFFAASVHLPRAHFLRKVTSSHVKASQGLQALVRASATGVRILGSFAVSSMPSTSSVQVGVIACPGGTTFGYYCGTAAHPAYGAFQTYAKGSVSAGTFDFGTIPTSNSGWALGILLFDGGSNGGYYPASVPVTVAVGGSSTKVSKQLSMAFVAPEINGSFSVAGAPAGYHYVFEAVACPFSVTADQLVFFEEYGDCAIAETTNLSLLGLYVTPGSWTVRYYYAPTQSGVVMFASNTVIAARFDLVGPTVAVVSESSTVAAPMTSTYIAPSVAGSVRSKLQAHTFFAAVFFADTATSRTDAGVYVNPAKGVTTKFNAFLDPGTYTPYSEAAPQFGINPASAATFFQAVIQQVGPALTVGPAVATASEQYAVQPFALSIQGGFSIPGAWDPANRSGEENAYPLSYVQVCPSPEPFSLVCSNSVLISPSELLGGTFNVYAASGGASMAFVYTTLSGKLVVGPPVTVPPSSGATRVTLSAPYKNASMWGLVTLNGDTNYQLQALWVQACPSTEAFTLECADGVSEQVVSLFYANIGPGINTVQLGYAIDLPHGQWNIAAAGSTDPTFATIQTLGPAKHIDVGAQYPVLNLSASV